MKTVNDLIKELQQLSPEKRKLPISIVLPNNMLIEPTIKIGYSKDIPSCFDKESVVDKIVLTW